MSAKRATLARDYAAPEIRTSWAMGNAQQVADGGVFVGWGTYPGLRRDRARRSLRFDARFAGTSVTFGRGGNHGSGGRRHVPRSPRRGAPSGSTLVYASWNGATEVARWQVRAARARAICGPCARSRAGGSRRRSHSVQSRASSPSQRSTGTVRARNVAAGSSLTRLRLWPPLGRALPQVGILEVAGGTSHSIRPRRRFYLGLCCPAIGDAAAHQRAKGPTMQTSSTTVDAYHLRVMVERMQQEDRTEQEIVMAVEEADDRSARRPPARRPVGGLPAYLRARRPR